MRHECIGCGLWLGHGEVACRACGVATPPLARAAPNFGPTPEGLATIQRIKQQLSDREGDEERIAIQEEGR
jgi:hypothetical protein